MAAMWKKAMTYLGLGDDEDYAEYDDEQPAEPRRAPERRPPEPRPASREPERRRPPLPIAEPSDVRVRGTVRPLPADPRMAESGVGAVTARSRSRGAGVLAVP